MYNRYNIHLKSETGIDEKTVKLPTAEEPTAGTTGDQKVPKPKEEPQESNTESGTPSKKNEQAINGKESTGTSVGQESKQTVAEGESSITKEDKGIGSGVTGQPQTGDKKPESTGTKTDAQGVTEAEGTGSKVSGAGKTNDNEGPEKVKQEIEEKDGKAADSHDNGNTNPVTNTETTGNGDKGDTKKDEAVDPNKTGKGEVSTKDSGTGSSEQSQQGEKPGSTDNNEQGNKGTDGSNTSGKEGQNGSAGENGKGDKGSTEQSPNNEEKEQPNKDGPTGEDKKDVDKGDNEENGKDSKGTDEQKDGMNNQNGQKDKGNIDTDNKTTSSSDSSESKSDDDLNNHKNIDGELCTFIMLGIAVILLFF
ncbi:hypothetical protein ENU1_035580 [Entamoeba nuttalli P19]|uniref:Uncharacterized protein n=2 Tax=Entamoeba nuttalli TaxID=412467 RepID=K2HGK6_ENTNP|nr:hypothetical protein ENU1_035580 [Entamoeba nuttalli P19]EKE42029.1 hypothetical protein ENU1_035580 [Entamoeba nuttalli P19]|eukprot:XP_008855641.1 hypothetical protein ENU1_035580 [Entamoeba nuttalli P19]